MKNYTQYGGKVTIDDTGDDALYFDEGDLTLARGTLTAKAHDEGRCAILLNNGHTATVSGGTLIATATGEYSTAIEGNLTMTGGTVNATGQCGIFGNATLGWTNATDRIYASSYSGTVTIAAGQSFINDAAMPEIVSGTITDMTKVNGKTLTPAIVLADNADNTSAIATATTLCTGGKTLAVQLSGRTLYTDGAWNTLCLPFDVSTTSGTLAGDNVVAKVLNTSSELDNGTLTLNFSDAPATIAAGTPFIIKWEGDGTNNLENPVFTGVTVSNATNDVNFTGGSFKGTYGPVTLPGNNKSNLYLGSNNKLYWPTANRTINAFRAYFHVDLDPGAPELNVVLNFGDEETTSLSEELRVKSEEFATAAEWYTLDGRKIANGQKPKAKGLYIVNGKKVVVK